MLVTLPVIFDQGQVAGLPDSQKKEVIESMKERGSEWVEEERRTDGGEEEEEEDE